MKKFSLVLSLAVISCTLFFHACTKINEATELGGDLIPAVDNVNTFETSLAVESNNARLDSADFLASSDDIAVGAINDPEFGKTRADAYFSLSSAQYGIYPFLTSTPNNPDSLIIDSVVLQLHYTGNFGDSNSPITIKVLEIDPGPTDNLSDTATYRFEHAAFPTTKQYATTSFTNSQFKNPVAVTIKRETYTQTNILRIPLDKSLGTQFASYDTAAASPKGGFNSDAKFKSLFKGLKLQADDASGNGALAYFNLTDTSSKLTVYFQKRLTATTWDTLQQTFIHNASLNDSRSGGQANFIQRTPSGPYLTYQNNGPGADDLLYLQSAPRPSFGALRIPALSGFPNRIIHRAELIAYRVPTGTDMFFTPAPFPQLYLDHIVDTSATGKPRAYLFHKDLSLAADGSISFTTFGGSFRGDSARINITRYVQSVITRNDRNDTLRLYLPYRANDYAANLQGNVLIPITQHIADSRIVLAGGSYSDPSKRLRLRIIYSNL